MFNGTLATFQEEHEINLLKKCADNRKLILQAPTGSGKTVLVTKFIDDYLDENPDTVFIWLCPGAGNLQDQSRYIFESHTSGIMTGSIYDFIAEYDPKGSVYFVNWDKITKANNIVNQEGERKTLLEKIVECRTKMLDFFMIVDEEHMNKATSEMYEKTIEPRHILRISATTKSKGDHFEEIKDDEVIASGLIASGISINEGLSNEAKLHDNDIGDLELLHLADEKRKEIEAEYRARGINIKPLVLIQFPNGSADWIERIKKELAEMNYTEENGLVTSWLVDDHPDDPEELRKMNGKYAFLLFKQAIATGWDCPRAKILVKLREGGSESFNIQTIGRIRRMPERHHYDSELLDHCYLYTLDSDFKEGLISDMSDSYYLSRYQKKPDAPSIALEKIYLPESDKQAVDEEQVVKILYDKLMQECDIDQSGSLSKKELELSKGFVFGTKLKTRAVEGIIRTTSDVTKLEATFHGEHEINIHDDGFIIRDAKRKIAQAIGIDEKISSKALSILFDSSNMNTPSKDGQFEISLYSDEDLKLNKKYKVINEMGHREYSAFLVNNWEIIAGMLEGVDKSDVEIIDTPVVKELWGIPRMQDYKKKQSNSAPIILEKNVFIGYGDDLLTPPKSAPEIAFEKWCEVASAVKWFYKNGDKGKEYFSIVYRESFRRYNFYPDYIIQTNNGDVWIIETKGGMKNTGETANIDKSAASKLDALREYCNDHSEIKWGFVRNYGAQLKISTTIWDENLFNESVWKPIGEVIK